MKSLIKNYIDKLDINKLKEFANKNEIELSNEELKYIYSLIKNNIDDILIDENPYLKNLKENINNTSYQKIEDLTKFYKAKYKGYLF